MMFPISSFWVNPIKLPVNEIPHNREQAKIVALIMKKEKGKKKKTAVTAHLGILFLAP